MQKKQFYVFLLLACLTGYLWLGYIFVSNSYYKKESASVCLIKMTTGIPCPSCGSSRSVVEIAHGNFRNALKLNPFGLIIATIMVVAPIWSLSDLIRKKPSLLLFFRKFESFLQKPPIAYTAILLTLANWIWNITKGL